METLEKIKKMAKEINRKNNIILSKQKEIDLIIKKLQIKINQCNDLEKQSGLHDIADIYIFKEQNGLHHSKLECDTNHVMIKINNNSVCVLCNQKNK